jgi:methyl-accepting chemotaxis protein/methyl-accepting chemotaxis protein-1 (serine sensor receptor)
MITSMTLGRKLILGFAALAAVAMLLGLSYLRAITSLGNEFSRSVGMTTEKIRLAGVLTTQSASLLSLERGVLVRLAMKDLPKAEAYHNSFNELIEAMRTDCQRTRVLLINDAGRAAVDRVERALASWRPAHQDLWQVGSGGNLKRSQEIYDGRTLPLAKEADAGAAQLGALQKENLAADTAGVQAEISRSGWTAGTLMAIVLLVGIAVLTLVLNVTRELRGQAHELADGAAQIAGAAAQVSSASQSLAQGASQQAASLEETSASTEELAAMTRRNADNSRQAASEMAEVEAHVVQGNQNLAEMIASMQDINTSSEKISRIIKVIDEIAFQTNILALNAAVEAARAGESGMGFAVVADEVRNLAQRSAQAAKDTSALIEESIASSKNGTARLDRVTQAIAAITGRAQKVKILVDQVQTASDEQTHGIDQIAKTVAQMEQVTQSTAASAEETASVGEELAAQTQSLNELAARLRIMVEGHLMPATPAPQAVRTRGILSASGANGGNSV